MEDFIKEFKERFDDYEGDPTEFGTLVKYVYKYLEDRRLCGITTTYIQILNAARVGGMMTKKDFQKNVLQLLTGFKQNLSIDFEFKESFSEEESED